MAVEPWPLAIEPPSAVEPVPLAVEPPSAVEYMPLATVSKPSAIEYAPLAPLPLSNTLAGSCASPICPLRLAALTFRLVKPLPSPVKLPVKLTPLAPLVNTLAARLRQPGAAGHKPHPAAGPHAELVIGG